jgi:hypothetical protein
MKNRYQTYATKKLNELAMLRKAILSQAFAGELVKE